MANKEYVVLVDKDCEIDFFAANDKENVENATGGSSRGAAATTLEGFRCVEIVSIGRMVQKCAIPLPECVSKEMRQRYRTLYQSASPNQQLPSVYFLIGDGEVVNAHQGLLRLYAPHVFHMALENGGNMIQLDESAYTRPAVHAIVQYLYLNYIYVTRQNCHEMLNFARFMQLHDLCHMIRSVKKKYAW